MPLESTRRGIPGDFRAYVGGQRIGGLLVGVLRRACARGFNGVDLVVSDNHKGLVKAIETHFQGATWQRCQTHLIRNILDACPKALQGELHGRLRLIFDAPDVETARGLLNETIEAFGARAPKAVERLEVGFEDAHEPLNSAAPTLPEMVTHHQRSRAAKATQIRRRERVIRIFSNEESALRQFLGGGCGDR